MDIFSSGNDACADTGVDACSDNTPGTDDTADLGSIMDAALDAVFDDSDVPVSDVTNTFGDATMDMDTDNADLGSIMDVTLDAASDDSDIPVSDVADTYGDTTMEMDADTADPGSIMDATLDAANAFDNDIFSDNAFDDSDMLTDADVAAACLDSFTASLSAPLDITDDRKSTSASVSETLDMVDNEFEMRAPGMTIEAPGDEVIDVDGQPDNTSEVPKAEIIDDNDLTDTTYEAPVEEIHDVNVPSDTSGETPEDVVIDGTRQSDNSGEAPEAEVIDVNGQPDNTNEAPKAEIVDVGPDVFPEFISEELSAEVSDTPDSVPKVFPEDMAMEEFILIPEAGLGTIDIAPEPEEPSTDTRSAPDPLPGDFGIIDETEVPSDVDEALIDIEDVWDDNWYDEIDNFDPYEVARQGQVRAEREGSIQVKFNSFRDDLSFDRSYVDQLELQELGLRAMTHAEFLANVEAYKEHGRQGDYEKQYREAAAIISVYDEGEAETIDDALASFKGLDAIHLTDQIAGGSPDLVCGLGDSRVNRSIGAKWRSLIPDVVEEVKQRLEADPSLADTRLNIRLIATRKDE